MDRPVPASALERLLLRCHRDELLPLARAVDVNPRGLGLGSLARATAMALRQMASHLGKSLLFRRGEPNSYEEIVATLAEWPTVPEDRVEEAEIAFARRWAARKWADLDLVARGRLWSEMGMAGQPPETGGAALEQAESALGRGFAYALSRGSALASTPGGFVAGAFALTPLGCLLRPLFFGLLPFFVWFQLTPDPARVESAVLHVARLRQVVRHRVTIGVVGCPSTGKDAAIKALFGIDTGNISPIAGSTKEVTIQALPGATALYVVNTPGLGDVVEAVSEEARQVLGHIDVYLYIVNAEGGVQARELADWRRCVASGKPSLAVVNKVDVLRPRDKEKYLSDARAKLGAPERDFLAVAFDPLPQLAPGPIGVDLVRGWLRDRLVELGKDPDELPAVG